LTRPDGRAADQLRVVTIELNASPYAEGSALITMGETKVLCTASVEERRQAWLRARQAQRRGRHPSRP